MQENTRRKYHTIRFFRTILYKKILEDSTIQKNTRKQYCTKISEDSTMHENTRRKYHTNRFFRTILYKKIL